jgi:ABC-type transport system involved in multi-copper enzyme maturation permease subunit
MFGPTFFRDSFLVAGFELRDMTRSRRAFLFAALYLIVAAFGSYFFVQALNTVQPISNMGRNRGPFGEFGPRRPDRQATTPTRPTDPNAPAQRDLFQETSPFRAMLRSVVTDNDTFYFLVAQPPITLFHFWISFFVMPLVIMLTSSESIAQEIQTRGVRFVGLRTGRAEFVLGKVLGQAVTIALLTLLAGGMCMAIAWWKLSDFEFLPALLSTLLFWPRLACYCMAFLGLAGLCSMNSSSPVASRTFSIMGLVGLWLTHHLSQVYIASLPNGGAQAQAWKVIDFLTPYSHQGDLWFVQPGTYGWAMVSLIFLAALYIGIGLIFYRRRDL